MGPTALLPLRKKACWGIFHPKNPTASAGCEPAKLGTKGQHTTEVAFKCFKYWCELVFLKCVKVCMSWNKRNIRNNMHGTTIKNYCNWFYSTLFNGSRCLCNFLSSLLDWILLLTITGRCAVQSAHYQTRTQFTLFNSITPWRHMTHCHNIHALLHGLYHSLFISC